jgi:glycosyltransferase involved in cell wall biosynthesis
MSLNPLARSSVRRSGVVLATNADTARLARHLGGRQVEVVCDTGVDPARIRRHAPLDTSQVRRVTWVGSLVPGKGLPLALTAVDLARREVPLELTIVGDGPLASLVDRWRADAGPNAPVRCLGRIPWTEVQDLYDDSDVLLFTSVRESFGAQIAEAAAAGLPIVAVDLHGVSSLVPRDVAVKVPFTDQAATAAGLAEGLVDVLTDPARHQRMSRASTQFAYSVAWPARARLAVALYEQLACDRTGRVSTPHQDRRGRQGSRR